MCVVFPHGDCKTKTQPFQLHLILAQFYVSESEPLTIMAAAATASVALNIHGSLLDGRSAHVVVHPKNSCWDLQRALQESLGTVIGRMVFQGSAIRVLTVSLEDMKFSDGDHITCLKQGIEVFSRFWSLNTVAVENGSIAYICTPGMTNPHPETESSQCVHSVAMTNTSIAVLTTRGSVLTWGESDTGGDSAPVQNQLKNRVRFITSTETAFCALLSTKRIVTWPATSISGGNSSAVEFLGFSWLVFVFLKKLAYLMFACGLWTYCMSSMSKALPQERQFVGGRQPRILLYFSEWANMRVGQ